MEDAYFLPMSALKGDNVVDRSTHMPWFDGHSLLEHLETVDTSPITMHAPFRMAVQRVVRPDMNVPRLRGADCFGHGAARR